MKNRRTPLLYRSQEGIIMLATLIPFFDKDMNVCAYSLFSQKHNLLLQPSLLGSRKNDGAASVDGLDIIKSIGIDTLSPGLMYLFPWVISLESRMHFLRTIQ